MQRTSKLLAVDDNPVNLRVLESLLVDYSVRTATSGGEALQVALNFRPDVVLLDIMMPGIDGYATCRQMRMNPSLRHTKIIMVSVKSELNERLAGYEAGADDYIAKPFDGDELLAKVQVYAKLKSVEEIEEIKDHMIEVLQHSNRTPLTNIISYAELLNSESELDDDILVEAPKAILRNARRFQRFLEKGERLASLKSGQFRFEFTTSDICPLMRQVLADSAPWSDEAGVSIELDMPHSAEATFDRGQVQFAIQALLDNAIRFSNPGGVISVTLVSLDGELVLAVTDQGPGISDELLPRVFEPFGNPDSPLFNHGDGLSLAIVQQIAWAHGGDIHVDSRAGSGTAFSMSIRIAGADRREQAENTICGA